MAGDTTLVVQGVLQPATEQEVQHLEEGKRSRAKWKFYTTTALLVGDVATGQLPDRVVVAGVEHVVEALANWQGTAPVFGAAPSPYSTSRRKYLLLQPEVV